MRAEARLRVWMTDRFRISGDGGLFIDEGKPTGVISRQDLLAFLAKGGK